MLRNEPDCPGGLPTPADATTESIPPIHAAAASMPARSTDGVENVHLLVGRLTAGRHDALDHGCGGVGRRIEVADDDLGALGGEELGCRRSETVGAAGDEGPPAVEST